MGLGQEQVKTEGEAADIILGRDFPTTLELKDVTKDTFIPRSIGVNHIPSIFLSEISEIAEPKEYESQLRKKGENSLKKSTKQSKRNLLKEQYLKELKNILNHQRKKMCLFSEIKA